MDFMEMYAQKKMTAEQAASLVKSGDWVDYGWCVNTPVAVDAALAKRLPELENVNFRGGILGNSRTDASGRGRPAQLSYNINKEQNQALFRKK